MMFGSMNAFSDLEAEAAQGMVVGWAPSQAVLEAIGFENDGPRTAGASATSAGVENPAAPAVPMAQGQEPFHVDTGTTGTDGDVSLGVKTGLPASLGSKRRRVCTDASRVQGSLQWTVSVPEDHKIPSLFVKCA